MSGCVGGRPLDLKDPLDRLDVLRVGSEAVDRLRREGHQAAGTQDLSGAPDVERLVHRSGSPGSRSRVVPGADPPLRESQVRSRGCSRDANRPTTSSMERRISRIRDRSWRRAGTFRWWSTRSLDGRPDRGPTSGTSQARPPYRLYDPGRSHAVPMSSDYERQVPDYQTYLDRQMPSPWVALSRRRRSVAARLIRRGASPQRSLTGGEAWTPP